jgi:hypothetical protein
VVATGVAGFIEELREALGAPTVEKGRIHRKHPPSLVAIVWRDG